MFLEKKNPIPLDVEKKKLNEIDNWTLYYKEKTNQN